MDTHGRTAERAVLAAVVDGARAACSGVLVLRGAAGVGKSTLLDDAVRGEEDLCTLRARGVESEAEFAFGALHQLLRPVLGHVAHLPVHQAAALRVAIGLEGGAAPDRFLVALAVLGVLAGVAETTPVVCLVDDAQWLDHASASTLLFVARRLGAERVGMLFAARDDDGDHDFPASGLPELVLVGLDLDAARLLLDERSAVPVDAAVAARLLEWTGGNPLALIELPSLLTPDQLAGHTPLPDPLPATAGVERIFAERAGLLSATALGLLLVAAAEDSGRLVTILAAARELGAGEAELDAAERSGLITVRDGTVAFRHPLVRSAVYGAASAVARHDVHRALARVVGEAGDADRRAWHLAAAALAPDEIVVHELDATAERARGRGGFSAAATALHRGADLTASGQARCRRLLLAAENAWLAGQFGRVSGMLAAARPLATEPLLRAGIGRLRGWLEFSIGSPATAHRILVEAARDAAPLDAPLARALLAAAAESAWLAGDRPAGAELASVAAQLPPADGDRDRLEADLLAGFLRHLDGDGAAAVRLLTATIEAAGRIGTDDLRGVAAHQAFHVGDDDAALRLNAQVVAGARATGAAADLLFALPRLVQAELVRGNWTAAAAGAAEAARLAQETGQDELAALPTAWLALLAALRGDDDGFWGSVARVDGLAATHPLGVFRVPASEIAQWARAMQKLATGRPASASALLDDLVHPVVSGMALLDRVDAAVQAGHRDRARVLLPRLDRTAEHTGAAWARARAAHGRGLLADGAVATGHFEEALAHHEKARRPFERARTELAHGEALRRSRRRVDARTPLDAALVAFEKLGAAPWADRAGAELRACGRTTRRRDPATLLQLTPQEVQVARFVANGLPTREVAAQLFLSPRTVDFHLRNVFGKLGISSRAELAALHLD